LNCSSRAKPPASFTWFRNSKHGAINVSVGQVYRLQMTNMTDIESYYCVAANILGSERSTSNHLKNQEMEAITLWGAVVGGLIGIIIAICLVFILWRLKSKRSNLHQTQKSGSQEPVGSVENQDSHYVDIDFSRMRASFKTTQCETEQQNVVYAQVKVCRTENRPIQTEDGTFAQVKKKEMNLHST
ncbi:hypothetical protein XENORESO_018095, partial [Xenotaenia resolanae]